MGGGAKPRSFLDMVFEGTGFYPAGGSNRPPAAAAPIQNTENPAAVDAFYKLPTNSAQTKAVGDPNVVGSATDIRRRQTTQRKPIGATNNNLNTEIKSLLGE